MRTRRTAASRLAALTLLPLLVLTGCSGGDGDGGGDGREPADGAADQEDAGAAEDAAEPPAAVVPAASLTADLELPLDAYRISDEDQRLLEEARDRHVTECMARYGQQYTPAEHTPAAIGAHIYLYGVDDPELAAEHGYMHPIDLDPATYAPAFTDDLTPEQELALYGDPGLDLEHPETLEEAERMTGPELNGSPVPVTGCFGEATLTINRPDADWVDPTVIFQLADEAGHHADEDERVTELLADWSACMAGHGHETTSPLDVPEELGLAGDVSGEAALAVAVVDVECKIETDLINRWAAVDAEHQREVIEENSELLERYREQHEERMARATRSS